MVYNITMEEELEEQLNQLRGINIKEHTILSKKIEEMQMHASVLSNHNSRFNTFDKPLQDYKWIEINDKILVFTIDIQKEELHLCEYVPKEEVFC